MFRSEVKDPIEGDFEYSRGIKIFVNLRFPRSHKKYRKNTLSLL